MKRDITQKLWRKDDAGYLRHDADCFMWDTGLCTCGLLHHLTPLSKPDKYVPDFWEQLSTHEEILAKITQ